MPELRVPDVIPVNDHVWLLDDNHQAACYVVVGTRQAAVIDTSLGMSNIRAVAESLTPLPLILINTHGHEDHVGGNWAFEKAYMNLADLSLSQECLDFPEMQAAIKEFGLRFPPYEDITDGQVFDLGGVELEAIHFPGHTAGEIVLLDRKDRILFTGDGIVPHLWLQLEESLPIRTQVQSMEKLLPLRDTFDTILTGHSREPGSAEIFDSLLSALKDLEAGNTADDIDYEWLGFVSRAHPYCGDRRIVYDQKRL